MRNKSVWERACGLTRTVVEGVDFDDDAHAIVVSVRPAAPRRGVGAVVAVVAHRVMTSVRVVVGGGRWIWARRKCSSRRTRHGFGAATHGVTVAAVPWARHGAGHTRDFDDLAAWLAVRTSKSAVMELLRVAWRTVGSIVTRVNADIDATIDRLDGLRRIGIDEISYKRGHRYLIVVVDHDSGRLVWAGPGRNDTALERVLRRARPRTRGAAHPRFGRHGRLDRPRRRPPGPERVAQRRSVPCRRVGDRRARHRTPPSVERSQRSSLRPAGLARQARSTGDAQHISHARYALWKNPGDLTGRQRHQLDWIAKTDPRLWRAYLLKEGLRYVFAVKGDEGKAGARPMDRAGRAAPGSPRSCNSNAASSRTAHAIDAALDTGLSQGLVESTNTKIRLLTRIAFGFHGHQPLIALAMLALGSHPPRLPGRT